ncbi:hypothetical protein SBRCBS47491_007858 [Sporothrix bragantina]|uniref:Formylmethionine deformylase-like protein n=1 Tax=Sporothrix bragantina TaxID=671064 RepID=A0ABP0CGM7_9PEZI
MSPIMMTMATAARKSAGTAAFSTGRVLRNTVDNTASHRGGVLGYFPRQLGWAGAIAIFSLGAADATILTSLYWNSKKDKGPGGYQPINANVKASANGQDQFSPISPRVTVQPIDRPPPTLGVHWLSPAVAIVLFVASFLFALGHDLYNSHLNGKLADTSTGLTGLLGTKIDAFIKSDSDYQTWAIRIGTGLTNLSTTALSKLIALIAAQQAWFTLRRKAMSIDGIDHMFGVLDDPLAIFNTEIWAHAKGYMALAVLSYGLWFVKVITPATLSVQPRPYFTIATMPVPTLNMTDHQNWVSTNDASFIDGPHFDLTTLFTNTYTSAAAGQAGVAPISPAPFLNASYDVSFHGPSYKCFSFSDALSSGMPATWTIGNPTPSVKYTTFRDAFTGELGVELDDIYIRPNWVALAGAAPGYMFNTILISTAGINPLWNDGNVSNQADPDSMKTNIVCQLYNTSYDITIEYTNGAQTIVPRNVQLLEQQAWNGGAGMETLMSPCRMVPNISLPTSLGNCSQATATYYATHLLFSNLLSGKILNMLGVLSFTTNATNSDVANTIPLMQSPLIHCPEFYNSTLVQSTPMNSSFDPTRCRNGTLAATIEDLSRNFTYSMLSFKGWTTPPTTKSIVTQSDTRIFFVYARGTLWAAYAPALFATLLAVFWGWRVVKFNGVVSSISFSSTLLTTRNPELRETLFNKDDTDNGGDEFSTAYMRSVGAQPLADAVGRLRLRFGYLVDEHGADYAGFGVDGKVEPWRKSK